MSGNKDKAFDILYYLWELTRNKKISWAKSPYGFMTETMNGFVFALQKNKNEFSLDVKNMDWNTKWYLLGYWREDGPWVKCHHCKEPREEWLSQMKEGEKRGSPKGYQYCQEIFSEIDCVNTTCQNSDSISYNDFMLADEAFIALDKFVKGTSEDKMSILFKKEDQIYGCFSNFSPHTVELDGETYATSEHYYQAMKAKNRKDHDYIASAPTPHEARKRGQACELRDGWDEMKDNVMRVVVQTKFTQHPDLAEILLATEDKEIIEWAPWDEYWGNGKYGNGKNKLGVILMEVRDILKQNESS